MAITKMYLTAGSLALLLASLLGTLAYGEVAQKYEAEAVVEKAKVDVGSALAGLRKKPYGEVSAAPAEDGKEGVSPSGGGEGGKGLEMTTLVDSLMRAMIDKLVDVAIEQREEIEREKSDKNSSDATADAKPNVVEEGRGADDGSAASHKGAEVEDVPSEQDIEEEEYAEEGEATPEKDTGGDAASEKSIQEGVGASEKSIQEGDAASGKDAEEGAAALENDADAVAYSASEKDSVADDLALQKEDEQITTLSILSSLVSTVSSLAKLWDTWASRLGNPGDVSSRSESVVTSDVFPDKGVCLITVALSSFDVSPSATFQIALKENGLMTIEYSKSTATYLRGGANQAATGSEPAISGISTYKSYGVFQLDPRCDTSSKWVTGTVGRSRKTVVIKLPMIKEEESVYEEYEGEGGGRNEGEEDWAEAEEEASNADVEAGKGGQTPVVQKEEKAVKKEASPPVAAAVPKAATEKPKPVPVPVQAAAPKAATPRVIPVLIVDEM